MEHAGIPTCWKCGYELRGIIADGVCPECATPVWSRPAGDAASIRRAKHALGWGIASLVLFFVCLGPLSAFVAIPAVVMGGRVRRDFREGRVPKEVVGGANAGFWMGWAVIAFAILNVAILMLFFGAALLPFLFGIGP